MPAALDSGYLVNAFGKTTYVYIFFYTWQNLRRCGGDSAGLCQYIRDFFFINHMKHFVPTKAFVTIFSLTVYMPCTLPFPIYTFVVIYKINLKFHPYQSHTEREETNASLQSAEVQKCKRKCSLNILMVLILIMTD